MGADADPELVERHRGYLAALARLQLAARPWLAARLDASDLVQQVMLKAYAARADATAASSYNGYERVVHWRLSRVGPASAMT